MTPPEPVAAAYRLFEEAWGLQRVDDDGSRLLKAWEAQVEKVATEAPDLSDAAGDFAYYRQDFGLRAGLLLGAMLAAKPDGSELTVVDAARALADAGAWLDADAGAAWPTESAPRDPGAAAWAPGQQSDEEREGWAVVRSTRRALESAVVGDAVAAATSLWRSMTGVDVNTATVEEMLELDRLQQDAALEGRARVAPLIAAGTAPAWVWEVLRLTQS